MEHFSPKDLSHRFETEAEFLAYCQDAGIQPPPPDGFPSAVRAVRVFDPPLTEDELDVLRFGEVTEQYPFQPEPW